MNRVKKNVAEFNERIQDWIDIKENSQDQFDDKIKDMTISEKSDVEPAREDASNQARDSSVQIIDDQPIPENAQEEIKDDGNPVPVP